MFGKIGDIAKTLGNLDVGKAKDTVDALWDDRDKISDTANLVWDNRDEIQDVNDTGGDLNNVGGLLRETGTTLQSLASMGG